MRSRVQAMSAVKNTKNRKGHYGLLPLHQTCGWSWNKHDEFAEYDRQWRGGPEIFFRHARASPEHLSRYMSVLHQPLSSLDTKLRVGGLASMQIITQLLHCVNDIAPQHECSRCPPLRTSLDPSIAQVTYDASSYLIV